MRRRQALSKNPDQFAVNTVRQREDVTDLHALYVAKFGKRPHHRMKRETIIARLNDDASNISA